MMDEPISKEVPKGWKEVMLEEIVFPVSDPFSFKNKTEVHFLNTGDILDGKLLHNDLSEVSSLPGQAKKSFQKDDILYSEIRPANKRYMFVDFDASNSVASTKLMVLRAKENINKNFLYKLLTAESTLREFQSIAESRSGTFPQITFESISTFSLSLPPPPEQKAIADVLSSLDDKIELLQKQNKTLETIAQTLFKRWFVDFEFPDEKGKPYKSSGGKMIESELGEIPNGWSLKPLSEFGQIICGKTPSKSNREFFGGEIPFIKIPDMQTQLFLIKSEDSLTTLGANTQKNKYIPEDSICVSCIATVGLVRITTKKSQTNQQINSIIPKSKEYREYLYLSMTNLSGFLNTIGSGGTATLNINTGIFSNLKILYPDNEIISSFNSVTSPLFNKIKFNSNQIDILCRCRDVTLPKLMSGEVRVREKIYSK